jgi:hypothetical protein
MKVTALATVVCDEAGKAIGGAIAYLRSDAIAGGFLFAITKTDGYAIWPRVPVPFSGVLQLAGAAAPYGPMGGGELVEIPDAENITIRVGPSPSNPQDVQLPPASFRKPVGGSPTIHGRLRSTGPRLYDDVGPWRWKIVTAFSAQADALAGDWAKVKAYASWTRSVGGNGWRVFLNWGVIGLDYRQHADYFQVLDRLCAFTAGAHLRLLGTAVCDQIPSGLAAQQNFLDGAFEVLSRYVHTLGECANEPYNGNSELPTRFVRTSAWGGLPVARGMCRPDANPLSGDPHDRPYLPGMGYTTYQNGRSEDWPRKVGKDGFEIYGGVAGTPPPGEACVNNEPMGAAETYQSGRRSNRTAEFAAAGGGAALFTSGCTGHGDSLTMQRCVVPGPVETACIKTLFEAIDFVPVDAPTWTYTRYGPGHPGEPMPVALDPLDTDDHARMHAMVGPGVAACVNYNAAIPGREGWVAAGANGWRIRQQRGPVVVCER